MNERASVPLVPVVDVPHWTSHFQLLICSIGVTISCAHSAQCGERGRDTVPDEWAGPSEQGRPGELTGGSGRAVGVRNVRKEATGQAGGCG